MDTVTSSELEKKIAMLQSEKEKLALENETLRFQIKKKDEEIKLLKDKLEELQNKPPSGGSWMAS